MGFRSGCKEPVVSKKLRVQFTSSGFIMVVMIIIRSCYQWVKSEDSLAGCQCVNINKKLVLYVTHAQMSKYLANERTAWHSDFSIALLHFASKTPLTSTLKGVRNI